VHFSCACFVPLGVLSQPDNAGPAARKILIGVVSTSMRNFCWQRNGITALGRTK
jgi:hypothetical protein